MHRIELILNSALLWIFLQTLLSVLITVLYEFCIPWIVWGSLIIVIALRLARVSPPPIKTVQEVLGVNPFLLGKDNSVPEKHGNGEQYCMRVVAHRGGGYDYPENSLLAFRNVKLHVSKYLAIQNTCKISVGLDTFCICFVIGLFNIVAA